jgi:hypothetical protein
MRRITWLVKTLGLDAVVFLQSEGFENGPSRCANIRLRVGVDFQHAVESFHDLHAGRHIDGLQGDVGDAVDLHTGGDFDEQGCLAGDRQKSLRHRPQKRGELGLETVDK